MYPSCLVFGRYQESTKRPGIQYNRIIGLIPYGYGVIRLAMYLYLYTCSWGVVLLYCAGMFNYITCEVYIYIYGTYELVGAISPWLGVLDSPPSVRSRLPRPAILYCSFEIVARVLQKLCSIITTFPHLISDTHFRYS